MLTILNVCFFAEQLLTLHIANDAYVMVARTERKNQWSIYCTLLLCAGLKYFPPSFFDGFALNIISSREHLACKLFK